jgi:hypothetical protein
VRFQLSRKRDRLLAIDGFSGKLEPTFSFDEGAETPTKNWMIVGN